jgi:hypothetical protein
MTKPMPPLLAIAAGKRPRLRKVGAPRRTDRNAEARVQAAAVDWIRAAAPQVLVFHPANGGWRRPAEAARFKWIGVVAGIPDLVIVVDPGRVFFLEVKAPGGGVSDVQRDIIFRLGALRAPCAIVQSIEDVRQAFALWGIPTREAGR